MAKKFLVPIDMNGLEIQNFLVHNLAAAPTGASGRIYFNTADKKLYYYNGTSWVDVTSNLITGVKGSAESTYRTGQVSISAANVGAAPTSHASTGTTYGVGTNANYGHVKLSDATNDTTDATGAIAATPKAVKDALDAAKTYADGIVAASDAMVFKGTLGTGGTITDLPTSGVKVGDTYRVVTAGTYGGHACEVGDLVIAIATTPTWAVAQTNITGINKTTESIGSASTGTAIPADDITAWTTNTPTVVTKKTVVTGGTTTDVPNISKKTVVTSVTPETVVKTASGATAAYSNGVLTITDGSFSTGASATVGTGDSVTVGTAIKAYTSLTTGDSVSVTPGTAASLSYTAKSIPNISVTSKTVVTDVAFTTD